MAQPSSSAPGQGDDSSPQGGAPQPGGQPGQPQPPAAQGQDQGGGPITQLLSNVGGALQHLEQIFASSKAVDPQDQKMMSQIVGMYGQLMQSLGSPGGGDQQPGQAGPPGGAQGQTAPMESAGNPGAKPVM